MSVLATKKKDERPLHEILASIAERNDLLEAKGILLPGADEDKAALKDKIDAYRFKIMEWEEEAAAFQGRADFHQRYVDDYEASATALRNKAKQANERVAFLMDALGLERLPGNEFAVVLQYSGNPKTVYSEKRATATATDYKNFPGMVEQVPRSYHWKTDEVRDALKLIEKKKEAGETITDADEQILAVARLEYSFKAKFGPAEIKAKGKAKK